MNPGSAAPCVQVVDDDEVFRDALVYALQSRGLQTRCHASGEAFLADWTWGMQGVAVLDIQFKPPCRLQGDDVFARLLALRCPMPILFMTGPFENDVLMCERLVSLRGDVRYLPKRVPLEARALALANLLARAPARLAKAQSDRDILQVVLDVLPPTEREVMSLVLQGMQTKEIVRELGGKVRVRGIQRASGLEKVPQAQGSWELLAHLVSPLMERMGASDLVHLAVIELGRRLCLLDAAQVETLCLALPGDRRPAALNRRLDQELPPVLSLLQAGDETHVRKWLRWARQEMLRSTLQQLPGDTMRPVREWLGRPASAETDAAPPA